MRIDLADVLIVIGAALVVYGTWLLSPPVALIVAGLLLLFHTLSRRS